MTYIPGLIAIGVAAFAATNIDDIFVLMMFSSSSSMTFPVKQVVSGQYTGIGLLVAISALGSFISLAVSMYIIALLGIVPIVIGIKKLVVFRKKNESNSNQQAVQNKKKNNLAFAAVAAVIFSK
jgi:cadmium resistance protein CadD (predicted permease)